MLIPLHRTKHAQRAFAAATVTCAMLLGLVTTAPSASAAPCSFSNPSPLPSADQLIETAADLHWLHDTAQAAEWGSGKSWTQTADIDMGGCEWASGISTGSNRFSATYDGGGYQISGLTITDATADFMGLFGFVTNGTVRNVNFIGNVTGRAAVGGLIGTLRDTSTVENSSFNGAVTGTNAVGGLIGQLNTAGTVTVSETHTQGTVRATSGDAGGLVGFMAAAPSSATVRDSYSTSTVQGTSGVGGLVGVTSGATGVLIADSYSIGSASGGTSNGGLIGDLSTASASNITDSFWNTETSGLSTSGAGTGKTTAEMTTLGTYSGWSVASGYDAFSTWGICSAVNSGYPFLTAFYTSDPCSGSPSPPAGGSLIPTTFRYFLPDGTECTAISPEVVVNHSRVLIPSADANCRTRGASLSGWSIPHQDWAFTPGYSVYVVASQRFTAILNESTATVILDANIESRDACIASIEGADTDLPVEERSEYLYLDRLDMSWYAPGDRPSLEVYPAPDSAPCTPPGYELVGWNTRGDGRGTAVAIGDPFGPAINEDDPNSDRNRVRFYAVWERTAS